MSKFSITIEAETLGQECSQESAAEFIRGLMRNPGISDDAKNGIANLYRLLNPSSLNDNEKNLVHKGKLITAIKAYRGRVNCSLKMAKRAVEMYQYENHCLHLKEIENASNQQKS